MLRRCSRLLALFLPVIALLAVPAVGQTYGGTLQIACGLNGSPTAADPIVDYGISPTNHLHSEAGAVGVFSPFTTVPQMMTAPTSCNLAEDHSAMWFPTPMKPDGTPATVTGEIYFLDNGEGGTGLPTIPLPEGFRLVTGHHDCTSTTCSVGEYQCAGITTTYHTIPKTCANNGKGYGVAIYQSAQCWTLPGQGMGNGTDLSQAMSNPSGGACPPGTTAVPGWYWSMSVGADGLGGYLASDNGGVNPSACESTGTCGTSVHVDYVNGMTNSAMAAINAQCLQVPSFVVGRNTCGVYKSTDPATDGQVWTFGSTDGTSAYWGHQVTFPSMTN